MKTSEELIGSIHAIVESERKLGWINHKRYRGEAVVSIRQFLNDNIGSRAHSRKVVFGHDNGGQTFVGYLVCWGYRLVIFDPAPEYLDYFSIISASASNQVVTITGDGLFSPRTQLDNARIEITIRYGTEVDPGAIKLISDLGATDLVIPNQQAYSLLDWTASAFGLKL